MGRNELKELPHSIGQLSQLRKFNIAYVASNNYWWLLHNHLCGRFWLFATKLREVVKTYEWCLVIL